MFWPFRFRIRHLDALGRCYHPSQADISLVDGSPSEARAVFPFMDSSDLVERAPARSVASYPSPVSITANSPRPAPPSPLPPPRPWNDTYGLSGTWSAQTKDPFDHQTREGMEIFVLAPDVALKLMCDSLEIIMELTGDVPATPPPRRPSTPNLRSIQAEKEETVRFHSRVSQASSRASTPPAAPVPAEMADLGERLAHQLILGSTVSLDQGHVRWSDTKLELPNLQHRIIVRKFYSKTPPPISLEDYLQRLHRYCPMSTAVMLATSLYVHRLTLVERVLAVTPRNVHRLLLGGLVTAMKALEDITYSHRRLAKVGGVSAAELGRLEISFCFVVNFDLVVDAEMLTRHVAWLRSAVG